ncbi:MAG TPA: dTDP-4-dehydrorhamnose 3,5-epimerase [Burkholderiales bacterium]
MQVIHTDIPDVLVFEPRVFSDERGFFFEAFNEQRFAAHAGVTPRFVQDNFSHSKKGVLRGLHYQIRQAQGKLVRALAGEVFDVAVDLRRGSKTFGKWVGLRLSAENKLSMWIPAGFAHGFLVLSESADFMYKTTDFYAPEHERSIRWNDPDVGIAWPLTDQPILNGKDRAATGLMQAELFP